MLFANGVADVDDLSAQRDRQVGYPTMRASQVDPVIVEGSAWSTPAAAAEITSLAFIAPPRVC
jgi:hypothetical protein